MDCAEFAHFIEVCHHAGSAHCIEVGHHADSAHCIEVGHHADSAHCIEVGHHAGSAQTPPHQWTVPSNPIAPQSSTGRW